MSRGRNDTNQRSAVDAYCDDPVEEVTQVKKKSGALAALAILLTGGFFLQSTLASNISLGTGSAREFGQGIQLTTACSGSTSLTVTPIVTFENGSSANYKVSAIKVTSIPDTCHGVDFTINAYGETATAPLALFNTTSTNVVIYNDAGTFKAGTGGTGLSVTSGVREFTVNFQQPVLLSSLFSKLTIQSGSHTELSCALGGICVLGETGPGGGKVFYVAATTFACGPTLAATCKYMELAPYPWGGNADPTRTCAQSAYQNIDVGSTGGDTASATTIGWGYRNTLAIIAQGNTDISLAAAPLARTYQPTVNGVTYTDWFLPSQDEATMIYRNKTAAGLTYFSGFWTSTSVASGTCRYVSSSNPDPFWIGQTKGVYYQVRPIRAF
jgi:hypothetical protein